MQRRDKEAVELKFVNHIEKENKRNEREYTTNMTRMWEQLYEVWHAGK